MAHAADDAEVVHVPGRLPEQLGDRDPALAVGAELEGGRVQVVQPLPGDLRHEVRDAFRDVFAGEPRQLRLWVERVHVAGTAAHEEQDHALRPAIQLRRVDGRAICRMEAAVLREEGGESEGAQAGAGAAEELAPGEERGALLSAVTGWAGH